MDTAYTTPRGGIAIDLNADVGEDCSPQGIARDRAMMAYVSSISIAAGGHAGDETVMAALVEEAGERGVGIGVHPAYPDREGFGRRSMEMPPDVLEHELAMQVACLGRVVRERGFRLMHLKPHGALYHAASCSRGIAEAIVRAGGRWSDDLVYVGGAGSAAIATWKAMGVPTASEVFADRAYEPDGTLRDRALPGALLHVQEACTQVDRLVRGGGVVTTCGRSLALRAQTIGMHSDTPGAVELAAKVRHAVEQAGCRVEPLGRYNPAI